MVPSKTFGIVADLKRGIAVRGAILCPLCDGDGEIEPVEINKSDLPRGPLHKDVCCECGGQGWCSDDAGGD